MHKAQHISASSTRSKQYKILFRHSHDQYHLSTVIMQIMIIVLRYMQITLIVLNFFRYEKDHLFVRKGCGRGKMKMSSGCEQQKGKRSQMCYCRNEDFCNLNIQLASKSNGNVSCSLCSSASGRCSSWCQGDYCWINALSNVKECGTGSLSLPFHYNNPSLFYSKMGTQLDQGTACVNIMAGNYYKVLHRHMMTDKQPLFKFVSALCLFRQKNASALEIRFATRNIFLIHHRQNLP